MKLVTSGKFENEKTVDPFTDQPEPTLSPGVAPTPSLRVLILCMPILSCMP